MLIHCFSLSPLTCANEVILPTKFGFRDICSRPVVGKQHHHSNTRPLRLGRAQPGGAEPGWQLRRSLSPLQSFMHLPSLVLQRPQAFLRVDGRVPDRGTEIQVPSARASGHLPPQHLYCPFKGPSSVKTERHPQYPSWVCLIKTAPFGAPLIGYPREQGTEFLCSLPVCALHPRSVMGHQF